MPARDRWRGLCRVRLRFPLCSREHADVLQDHPAADCLPRLTHLAAIDAAFELVAAREVTEAAMRARITTSRLDWMRVSIERLAFSQESMAREAVLCCRQDGLTLGELAADINRRLDREDVLLETCDPDVQAAVLSAPPGQVVGPLQHRRHAPRARRAQQAGAGAGGSRGARAAPNARSASRCSIASARRASAGACGTDMAADRGILEDLPILRFLPDDARTLVVRSFVPASYPFGSVIIEEGAASEAIHVIVSGRARIVKRGEGGEEIALSMLRAGDSFGDVEMLNGAPNPATIRASAEVLALRLDRPVFEALLDVNPEIRTYLELQVKHRKLQVFFKNFPAFSKVPAEAIVGIILAELDLVVFDVGQTIFKQGDPPGPLYLIESGRVRLWAADGARRKHVTQLGRGEYFGEMSVFRGVPRALGAETLTPCSLLSLSPETFRRLLETVPEFRAEMEARIAQYSYKDVAQVPAGVDQELLPAGAAAQEQVGDAQVDQHDPAAASPEAAPFEAEGRFIKRRRRIRRFPIVRQIDEMDCGAACLAMVCRHFGRQVSLARIRQLVHTGLDGTSLRSLCQRRRGAGPRGALGQGVAAQPRSHAAAGHRALGRQPLGGAVRRHAHARRPRRPGARAAARAARRVRGELVRLRGALRLHAAVRDGTDGRVEHRLDVAVRAAAPAAALARARPRRHRQRAADGAAGLHAGHRGPRAGRAGRRRCSTCSSSRWASRSSS